MPSAAPSTTTLQAIVRFRNGSTGAISYVTGGNSRFPKETLDAAAGGRSARLDNFQSGGRVGRAAAQPPCARAAARTRASGVSSPFSSRPSATGAPMPISLESLVATTSATIAVADSLASGRPSGCDGAVAVAAGLVRAPGRPACRRPRWPGGPATRPCSWPGRAGRCGPVSFPPVLRRRPPESAPVHRRAAAGHGRPGARARPRQRFWPRRTGSCGVNGRCWASPGPTWPRRTGSATRSPAAVRVPDRYAFRINHRSEEQVGNVKQVWEISRLQHLTLLATAWYLSRDERYARRVADQLRLLVAGEPVPVRRALDQRHRDRHPADQPGLDPAAAGRRGRVSPTCSRTTRSRSSRSAGTSSTWTGFRSRGSSANNHVIAEAAGQLVASCAFPWFRGERAAGGVDPRGCSSVSWCATRSRPASAASSPRTTRASSPNSGCWPRSRLRRLAIR